MVEARILKLPPLGGDVAEHRFDAVGPCTWVLFEDRRGAWCGVFGEGAASGRSSVVVFDEGRAAFVIAGGRGYVVDLERKEVAHRAGVAHLVTAVASAARPLAVAADWTDLYAFSPRGLVWRSERIARDGIILERAAGEEVSGRLSRLDGWFSFRLRLDAWTVELGPREVESLL